MGATRARHSFWAEASVLSCAVTSAFGGRRGRRLSPTPSVVDFVGGSRSSVAHAGMGARRQMRRHARQLASQSRGRGVGYFAFLRVLRLVFFAVFFAADFVLDLALFAITALLAISDGG